MTPIQSYRLLITPLAPIHIGTGESFEPTQYVIEDEVLFEFDTGAAIGAFSDADRKKLLEIGNRRPDNMMIQAMQQFFFERRALLMAHAVHRLPVLPGVANLYASRVGQVANREAGGGTVLNRLEIDRTAFEPERRTPVLYGSSLKGAIRTALLDRVNGRNPLRVVTDQRTGERHPEKNQGLQQRLFQFRAGKFELDPMRLIHLSDARWNSPENFLPTQVRFAVNRKRAPVVNEQGELRRSRAENLYQILECVSPGLNRGFDGRLTLQSIAALADQHADKLPAPHLRFDIRQIAEACNAFYRPILENELDQLEERRFVDEAWAKGIRQLLTTGDERLKRGEAFLLRVGRHSGAESVTLNGVRKIKILRGKDPETGKVRDTYEKIPLTWWLAAQEKDQRTELLPFGWLLVEVVPEGQPTADWPNLQKLCAPFVEPLRELAERLEAKAHELARLRDQIAAERQREVVRRREQEEAAAQREREEAERQARLATLTPNMRLVEEFIAKAQQRLAQLRGGKERQNTGIHSDALQLAKAALEHGKWSPEERRALAEALEAWLPQLVERFDRKDDWKEARKKLRLAALKGES
jgi:CRISPR-associated protein Csm5